MPQGRDERPPLGDAARRGVLALGGLGVVLSVLAPSGAGLRSSLSALVVGGMAGCAAIR